ncbi:hypothetical protein CcaverHIS002_0510310 [Cutaneotrichosporon cavernicola]|nr:hypothetical protein CcaverHIS002_0510310 [Cutaneotrichosporon cavernicola]BEJ01237.1 hypothetical protein CcaverHIS631_0510940 [Cutaneotrichosporon cavernicola]
MPSILRPALLTAAVALLALAYQLSRTPADEDTLTLGLVLGSERRSGNTIGIGTYLAALIPTLSLQGVVLDVVDLTSLNLPRTFVHVPSKPRPPSVWSFLPSADRSWATRVRRWDAVLFVAPEYNGHVPGLLKSALDRLYHEWRGRPAGLVVHGHDGGKKVLESGRALMAELGMEIVGGVAVSTGSRPVSGTEAWLAEEVGPDVEKIVRGLVAAAERIKAERR